MESHRRVKVVIPAAGDSRRYSEAGIAIPKPDLRVKFRGHTRTMLEHVISTIPNICGKTYVGLRPDMVGPKSTHFERVDIRNSAGQADTVLQILDRFTEDSPLLVMNSDALIERAALRRIIDDVTDRKFSVGIVVQRTHNEGMSYVDQVPHPVRFVEKQRLSAFGMSGAWSFRSSRELDDALRYLLGHRRMSKGEPYLSQALNYVGGKKVTLEIEPHDIVDWNTPEAFAASGAVIP